MTFFRAEIGLHNRDSSTGTIAEATSANETNEAVTGSDGVVGEVPNWGAFPRVSIDSGGTSEALTGESMWDYFGFPETLDNFPEEFEFIGCKEAGDGKASAQ